jgi:hypothetical protein
MAGWEKALNSANVVRYARADLKKKLQKDEITLVEAAQRPEAQTMRLSKLLEAQKGWGPTKVKKLFLMLRQTDILVENTNPAIFVAVEKARTKRSARG